VHYSKIGGGSSARGQNPNASRTLVVAPFDGVITQRNVDIGSLVQADATSGTFMFTIMQGSVIRTQVFVPQDQAFGLQPGIDAVVHVPEIPNRTFPGKVTRIANALQPGSIEGSEPSIALISTHCTQETRQTCHQRVRLLTCCLAMSAG
jgi:multidrug efflux pump subunit AcrA (membrane-fusion protein)